MLGQQVVHHARVLHADERAHDAQDTGRHPEVQPDAVGVARTGARTRADDHLVVGQIRHDFVNHREDGSTTTVDQALAANLDDVRVWQDGQDRRLVRLGQQGVIGERALGESRTEGGQELVLHVIPSGIPACCSMW